jgi:mono/diheme cytochrome c family protein
MAYKTYCAVCHMENGLGVTGLQPALVGSEVLAGDPMRLLRMTLAGPPAVLPADRPKFSNAMPPMDFLPDAELAAALTYAREKFANGAAAIDADKVSAARKSQP